MVNNNIQYKEQLQQQLNKMGIFTFEKDLQRQSDNSEQ